MFIGVCGRAKTFQFEFQNYGIWYLNYTQVIIWNFYLCYVFSADLNKIHS